MCKLNCPMCVCGRNFSATVIISSLFAANIALKIKLYLRKANSCCSVNPNENPYY